MYKLFLRELTGRTHHKMACIVQGFESIKEEDEGLYSEMVAVCKCSEHKGVKSDPNLSAIITKVCEASTQLLSWAVQSLSKNEHTEDAERVLSTLHEHVFKEGALISVLLQVNQNGALQIGQEASNSSNSAAQTEQNSCPQ